MSMTIPFLFSSNRNKEWAATGCNLLHMSQSSVPLPTSNQNFSLTCRHISISKSYPIELFPMQMY